MDKPECVDKVVRSSILAGDDEDGPAPGAINWAPTPRLHTRMEEEPIVIIFFLFHRLDYGLEQEHRYESSISTIRGKCE